jgi:hypothetical protein
LPSSAQEEPVAFFTSAGQTVLDPVHVSAASHSPAALRQTTVLLAGPHVPGTMLQAWQSFGFESPQSPPQQ